jgi:D-glycero-alpha-D-manno-heptose-7-phosphate kinase
VRETLKYLNIKDGVEIHYGGDLPARTGIGSSSAFTVGRVNAVYALQGKMVTKDQLSGDAIQIEQKMIGEVVGSQDQTLTAFGGLNHITFHASGKRTVTPVRMSSERQDVFRKHLMLFFTGFSRTASEIAEKVVARMGQNEFALEKMQLYVGDALNILTSSGDLQDFGKLLHDYWLLKRSLGPAVTNAAIDNIYEASRRAGALGGKILGAGGGGFLLLFVPPSRQEGVKRSLSSLLHVPFSFENHGSSIIVYEPVEISRAA